MTTTCCRRLEKPGLQDALRPHVVGVCKTGAADFLTPTRKPSRDPLGKLRLDLFRRTLCKLFVILRNRSVCLRVACSPSNRHRGQPFQTLYHSSHVAENITSSAVLVMRD